MSQATLEALALNEDVAKLKEIVKTDPELATLDAELAKVNNDLAVMAAYWEVPTLGVENIPAANEWLAKIQGFKGRITYYRNLLDNFDYKLGNYWNLGYNICMIQPSLEGLRSNDQRMAYIEQLFEELHKMRRAVKFVVRKIDTVDKNFQDGFWNLQQQQRNLQMQIQITSKYGS